MYAKYFVLFAMMATGYLMRRIRIINDAMNDGLNKFIVYFAYPCLLVLNIGKLRLGSAMLFRFLLMTALTCGLFVLYAAASRLYAAARRFPKRISNVAELAMSSPNDGFMGFPVAQIFFGPEGLLLMMAHNVGLNVYLFSYGLIALRRNNKKNPVPPSVR